MMLEQYQELCQYKYSPSTSFTRWAPVSDIDEIDLANSQFTACENIVEKETVKGTTLKKVLPCITVPTWRNCLENRLIQASCRR